MKMIEQKRMVLIISCHINKLVCTKPYHLRPAVILQVGAIVLKFEPVENPILHFPIPMDITQILSILKTCISTRSLKQGKLIHQKILTHGLQNNLVLCRNLITFYFSCHSYEPAKLVFQTIDNPLDITLWNGLLASYTKNFMFNEALEFFDNLLHFPYLKPDCYTYPSVLKACSGLRRVDYGKIIHSQLVKTGFVLDVVVSSSLVGMYAKCNLFKNAIQMFDEMPERDVACWNSVISCYYQDGQADKALEVFEQMKGSGFEPDSVTLTTAISSCARLLDLERGKEIHREVMNNGFISDDYICSALVDMYGKCGCLLMAEEVFKKIRGKNVVSWNSMISGYSLKGDSKTGIDLFRRMIDEGIKPTSTTLSSLLMACARSSQLEHAKFLHGYIVRYRIEPDIFINSSLIDLYFKCGCIQLAENVFRRMAKTIAVSWNVMISGYVTVGHYFEALGIFTEMRESAVKPDAVTLTSILVACSQLAALEKGKEIHHYITENKFETNEKVMGALLDMYAKCGAVEEALWVFNKLPERDFVSWTSMITAYGSHGHVFEALRLFGNMKKSNEKPDRVTFLAVISACSHAGLVNEGCFYFDQMISEYGIDPTVEHYACLIDLLGRAGKLHEAYRILQKAPNIRDNFELLSTLFSACHLHGELELGEEIAQLIIEKDSGDPATYITLSNMYASVSKWDKMRKVKLMMKKLELKKNPGCSWIEIGKKIQVFFVKDTSHPQTDMVYECLAVLSNHMAKHVPEVTSSCVQIAPKVC